MHKCRQRDPEWVGNCKLGPHANTHVGTTCPTCSVDVGYAGRDSSKQGHEKAAPFAAAERGRQSPAASRGRFGRAPSTLHTLLCIIGTLQLLADVVCRLPVCRSSLCGMPNLPRRHSNGDGAVYRMGPAPGLDGGYGGGKSSARRRKPS